MRWSDQSRKSGKTMHASETFATGFKYCEFCSSSSFSNSGFKLFKQRQGPVQRWTQTEAQEHVFKLITVHTIKGPGGSAVVTFYFYKNLQSQSVI